MILDKLLEIYYEKNDNLLKLEKLFKELSSKYKMDDKSKKINKDPILKEIGTIIAKEFGFKKITIIIDSDFNDTLNAMCIPVRQKFYGELTKSYVINKTGIKFLPQIKATSLFMITKPMLFSRKITSKEMVAILLHEIGHNFTQALIPLEAPILLLTDILMIYIKIILNLEKNRSNDILSKEIKSIINRFLTILRTIVVLIPYINHMARIILYKTSIIATIEGIIDAILGYSDEKFADNFVANYGYGEYLSSALIKMDKSVNGKEIMLSKDGKSNDFPIISKILKNILDLYMIIITLMIIEPHPETINRVNNTINTLKHELSSNDELGDETKKELLKQITNLEEIKDEYLNTLKDSKYSEIRILYIHTVDTLFKNGDILSKIVPFLNIEKVYDKIINKKEE